MKAVTVVDANPDVGLPNHLATIQLFDPDTGVLVCVMDGTYITGIRTAGTAAPSARRHARPDAKAATIIGAAVQGREHLRVLPLVRDLERINVCSLRFADAERLAELARSSAPAETGGARFETPTSSAWRPTARLT